MLVFSQVRHQIGAPVRRQASAAQLDYLAALIVKLANAGKIRWEVGPGSGRGYSVYDAKAAISRYKQMAGEM
jgi:hypothetical protein